MFCRRGLNYTDRYKPEKIFDLKGCKQKDKNNDQRAGSSTSRAGSSTTSAAAAAAAGSSSAGPSQQQQQQLPAVAAAAGSSSSAAEAADHGPFNSRFVLNDAPFDAETAQHRQLELEDFQRRGGFEVGDSSGRRRFMQPQTETVFMDSWDGVNIMRNAPDGSGRPLRRQRITIEGRCYQGRVDGTGDWEPGAQEWIRVMERTREGLNNGADRAWVQQEARQRKQQHERRMVYLRQQELAQRRQRRER